MSMVIADGDGTPEGDSTSVIEVPLTPRGGGGQCSLAAEGSAEARGVGWGSALLVLLGLVLRRRRRALDIVALLLLMGGGTVGCARVQPYECGRLAQPDMQISEEGDLDGGPEHALDYREGSAGGVGGNGGGCGCN